MTDAEITIRTSLQPGDLGRLVAFHGSAYQHEDPHFGLTFEAYVAKTVAEFILENEGRGQVFLAEKNGELVASAAMLERRDGARTHGQLRWVLTHPSVRGLGLGGKLVRLAIDHAIKRGWDSVFLETTPGLDVSMGLYKRLGFEVESVKQGGAWEGDLDVIMMRLPLK